MKKQQQQQQQQQQKMIRKMVLKFKYENFLNEDIPNLMINI